LGPTELSRRSQNWANEAKNLVVACQRTSDCALGKSESTLGKAISFS
jgi:hypothetical protein